MKAIINSNDYLQRFNVTTSRRLQTQDKGAPQPGEIAVSYNVIGIVEGTDPELKNEYVAITAHLDHLGIRGGEIYNGANDNATGSAVVMEISQAFSLAPGKRSVLFILFGAEEVGLIGSKYFVNSGLIPNDKIVANLNIDGVGRYRNQAEGQIALAAIGGSKICESFERVIYEANNQFGKTKLNNSDPNNYFARSDQYNFHKKGVPSVMFTDFGSGVYHTPQDDAEPIEYSKLSVLSKMIFKLATKIANADSRPCPLN